jgi:uncharacterized protein (DUF983 family)
MTAQVQPSPARTSRCEEIATDNPGRLLSMRRGMVGRCPACGQGPLFARFLKVADQCDACGTELHHHRADDLPPYLVIFLVGHLIGYGILTAETRFETPLWVHLAIWPALTLILAVALLQPVKGAVVGLQYALGMHGFSAARALHERWESKGVGHEGSEHHGSSHLDRA